MVNFHAHPDDEAIATSGTMMKAVADGHRVVLVVATKGEQGEPAPGALRAGRDAGRAPSGGDPGCGRDYRRAPGGVLGL